MKLKTTAILAACGVCLSAAGAFAIPTSKEAAGADPALRYELSPAVDGRDGPRMTGGETLMLDARLGRRLGRTVDLFVDGTNLFDAHYEEIAGVPMPGEAFSVSLSVVR